jgi:hypothetical protein
LITRASINTVSHWYEQFADSVGLVGRSPFARAELERAFYAGAFVMLDAMTKADIHESLDAVIALRESLDREIRDFFERFNQSAHEGFRSPFPPGNA